MDCEKCPIKAECEETKELYIKSFSEDLRPRLRILAEDHCPLKRGLEEIRERMDGWPRDLETYSMLKLRLKEVIE